MTRPVSGQKIPVPVRHPKAVIAAESTLRHSKWGNDLRQTVRTIGTATGDFDFNACLLMNHAVSGANAGYIARHKLLEDHLR